MLRPQRPRRLPVKLSDRIKYIRESGMVERCHMWPKVGQSYTNGGHSWGVCVLIRLLWPEDRHLVDFAMFHDVPERHTGDIPSPTIKRLPGLADGLEKEERDVFLALQIPDEHSLSDADWVKLRCADSLELWLWCLEQEEMGNKSVSGMRREMDKSWDARAEMGELPAVVRELIKEVRLDGWARFEGWLT